jgi:ATP-dependent protease ClpP protease subunit
MTNRFIRNLNILIRKSQDPILIHMKTNGGDWQEGMAIYDAIISCPNNVCILSYTHARSMSSIIFQAADKRVMMPHSMFMFHDGTMGYEGTSKQFLIEADELKKSLDIMLDIYIDSMKQSGKMMKLGRDKIKAWLKNQMNKKEDVYLNAQQAIDHGFADEIFDGEWDNLLKFK